MFPVYGGKCLSRKAVHNWVEKFSQGRSKVADDARPGAEVAETTVKRLLCSGFRRTGKAMWEVYRCWCRIRREINDFSRFEYHMFYVLNPFVTYLLTPHRMYEKICWVMKTDNGEKWGKGTSYQPTTLTSGRSYHPPSVFSQRVCMCACKHVLWIICYWSHK
jgi:hypothetical protein